MLARARQELSAWGVANGVALEAAPDGGDESRPAPGGATQARSTGDSGESWPSELRW